MKIIRMLNFSLFVAIVTSGVCAVAQTPLTTTTSLIADKQTAIVGTIFTLTATVMDTHGPLAFGRVTFYDGDISSPTEALGTVVLNQANGTATLKTSLRYGPRAITARFLGTHAEAASASTALPITVTGPGYGSTTTLDLLGKDLLTKVAGQGPLPVTGSVTFTDYVTQQVLSTVALNTPVQRSSFSSPPINMGYASTVADMNGDGKLDMIDLGSAQILIYPGDGDGTFGLPRTIDTPTVSGFYIQPTLVTAADLNGDGRMDLIAGFYSGESGDWLRIATQHSDGSFTWGPAIRLISYIYSYPVPEYSIHSIATGDFNGDGKLDLAVSVDDPDPLVIVLLGHGNGTFEAGQQFIMLRKGNAVVGDFNGDGDDDIATADYELFLSHGNGTFANPIYFGPPSGAPQDQYITNIGVGDFNGDGKLDLLFPFVDPQYSDTHYVKTYLGHGNGTFEEVDTPAPNPTLLATADFNDDGKLDIVFPKQLLYGHQNGSFLENPPTSLLSNPPNNFVAGDFNDDGNPDLIGGALFFGQPYSLAAARLANVSLSGGHPILATYSGDANYPGSVGLLVFPGGSLPATSTTVAADRQSGPQGTIFTLTATVTGVQGPQKFGSVNFYDGEPSGGTEIGSAVVNQATGTATLKTTLTVGTHQIRAGFAGVATAASSVSSPLTLAVSSVQNESATALTLSGSGSSRALTAQVTGMGPLHVTGTVTFNDTTASQTLGTATLGNATLGNSFVQTSTITDAISQPVLVDMNGDGKPDMVSVQPQSMLMEIRYGNGDGSFGSPQILNPANPNTVDSIAAFAVGDLNNDGHPDAVFVTRTGIDIILARANGGFAPVFAIDEDLVSPVGIAIGDFNGDGKQDLAVTTYIYGNGIIQIYLGNGDGTFAAPRTTSAQIAPYGNPEATTMLLADFNNDGNSDLLLYGGSKNGSYSYHSALYLGHGDGTFEAPIRFSTIFESVYAGDFNHDGKTDFVSSDANGANVVHLGHGNGTFEDIPLSFSSPSGPYPVYFAGADFNHDGNLDLAIYDPGSLKMNLLLGHSDGSFSWQSAYQFQDSSIENLFAPSIAVGDLNGDGNLDLAVLLSTGFGSGRLTSILANESTSDSFATLSGFTLSGTGNHNVTATYSGDSNFAGSTSAPVTVTAP